MSKNNHKRPSFSSGQALAVSLGEYGFEGRVKVLDSYSDANFLITADDGRQRVLKISNELESVETLDFQNQAMGLVRGKVGCDKVGAVCKSLGGQTIIQVKSHEGTVHFVRMLTFVPGGFWAQMKLPSDDFFFKLGAFMGQVDLGLKGFNHKAMNQDHIWNQLNFSKVKQYAKYIENPARRSMVERFFRLFEGLAAPIISIIPKGVIHNDCNDHNILVDPDTSEITGIIDFGDIAYSYIASEPAIAAAYATFNKENPLNTIASVVKGFNKTYPLTQAEIKAVYHLTYARLCTTVAVSAFSISKEPNNEYLEVSVAPAVQALEKLSVVSVDQAYDALFEACSIKSTVKKSLSKNEISKLRSQYTGASLGLSYKEPLHIVRGYMQYLFDEEGQAYLDAVNNVPHVGHCHPKVVSAACRQYPILNTNTRYLHENLVLYAKLLCDTMPDPLNVCFFVNSGSEANDLALRMARTHTQNTDLITVEGAYHGNLSSLIDISPYKFDGPGGDGAPSHVYKALMPDTYRGEFNETHLDAGKKYASNIKQIIEKAHLNNRNIAAFICESLLGCAGQIVLPSEYLKYAYQHVRQAGGVVIADEVQVGFGRIGDHFWGFEQQGVIPDICTLGKPIGNGHPLAAVITTKEIAHSFANGMEYFNTFGGNPVSCAVGLSVLQVIQEEKLQENAKTVGGRLKSGLCKLADRHKIIGDIRGLGLFVGIELVRDKSTLQPADTEASKVVEEMKNNRILLSTDGPLHNVIKIKPPLCFTRENADHLVDTLDKVLSSL